MGHTGAFKPIHVGKKPIRVEAVWNNVMMKWTWLFGRRGNRYVRLAQIKGKNITAAEKHGEGNVTERGRCAASGGWARIDSPLNSESHQTALKSQRTRSGPLNRILLSKTWGINGAKRRNWGGFEMILSPCEMWCNNLEYCAPEGILHEWEVPSHLSKNIH